ncbi:hypothetical protein [Psychrobacillus lasiicapitis]|uniref:Uncharacterized protein n=1 Tax=Psychrobacillus lasiicapitis TaxID=1636719 RepID=A0A544TH68_9BACI|nr:hypothetical protein [Psychrobacillus lasiicapitis]TQR16804.1 hypothetical protein FG382_01195 [Psychrobacillus lasiicapitis]GGA27064.1 hypothetical protein GCM10011384_15470 [Psychrobacillus lasiicapitis]
MIEAFRTLYKDRKFTTEIQSEEQIREVIKAELLDEFTHPRARLSPEKKLKHALDRIRISTLSEEEKNLLEDVYKEEYINLSTEDRT